MPDKINSIESFNKLANSIVQLYVTYCNRNPEEFLDAVGEYRKAFEEVNPNLKESSCNAMEARAIQFINYYKDNLEIVIRTVLVPASSEFWAILNQRMLASSCKSLNRHIHDYLEIIQQ